MLAWTKLPSPDFRSSFHSSQALYKAHCGCSDSIPTSRMNRPQSFRALENSPAIVTPIVDFLLKGNHLAKGSPYCTKGKNARPVHHATPSPTCQGGPGPSHVPIGSWNGQRSRVHAFVKRYIWMHVHDHPICIGKQTLPFSWLAKTITNGDILERGI
jgi:hypothetical protein